MQKYEYDDKLKVLYKSTEKFPLWELEFIKSNTNYNLLYRLVWNTGVANSSCKENSSCKCKLVEKNIYATVKFILGGV